MFVVRAQAKASLMANLAAEISFSLRVVASDPDPDFDAEQSHVGADHLMDPASASWASLAEYLEEFADAFGGETALGSTAAGDELVVVRQLRHC